jgi:hypothetical protein
MNEWSRTLKFSWNNFHYHHQLYGLGFVTCSFSELGLLITDESFQHLVGFPGRGFSPTQGLYLHRTAQHRKTRTNIHAFSGIRTNDQCPSGQEPRLAPRPGKWQFKEILNISSLYRWGDQIYDSAATCYNVGLSGAGGWGETRVGFDVVAKRKALPAGN